MERSVTSPSRKNDGTAARTEYLVGFSAGLVDAVSAILLLPEAVRRPDAQTVICFGALIVGAFGAAAGADRHARGADGLGLLMLVISTAAATVGALWSALSPPLVLTAIVAGTAMVVGAVRDFSRTR